MVIKKYRTQSCMKKAKINIIFNDTLIKFKIVSRYYFYLARKLINSIERKTFYRLRRFKIE